MNFSLESISFQLKMLQLWFQHVANTVEMATSTFNMLLTNREIDAALRGEKNHREGEKISGANQGFY